MKNPFRSGFVLFVSLYLGIGTAIADDAEGCKDHPLFNRFANYEISTCESRGFDSYDFPTGPAVDGLPGHTQNVEGAFTELHYTVKDGAKTASAIQILRNYQNAVKAAGGETVQEYGAANSANMLNDATWGGIDRAATMKLTKGGREVWVSLLPVQFNDNWNYLLRIVEREAMNQEIVADALLNTIKQKGFVTLYLNFDTGSATLKSDSRGQLDQVAQMLASAPDLNLEVAGHTDDVGTPESNLKLSVERARSVVAELTLRGVAASRLTPKGYGQSISVADNRTEEGRAKNRRVELTRR